MHDISNYDALGKRARYSQYQKGKICYLAALVRGDGTLGLLGTVIPQHDGPVGGTNRH